jgi:alpha-glucosidase
MSLISPWLRVALAALIVIASPSLAQESRADRVSLAARRDGADAHRGTLLMRVTALTDTILRVRIGRDDTLPEDASWAVPAAERAKSVAVTDESDGFSTAELSVHIGSDLRLIVDDRQGHTIVADAADAIQFSGRGFTLRKTLPRDEHIFGLGDKTGGLLDRRGESFVDWNTDSYGFTSATDPIYKSIPFYIGVGGTGGSYGILFDNTWRAWFDFGHREEGMTTFGAPDGPIDYYIIAGPSTADVVRRYTDLTGKAPLTPLWALGYQQSRYSYMSSDELRSIVATLRKDRVPTDVVWLDIDLQDRNRPFTVNKTAYPDLKGLVSDLKAEGVQLVTIADLHVAYAPNQGYTPYDTGVAGNHFVHSADGSVFVGKVWPGPSVFPDFTDTSARRWWGTQFEPFVADGVAGFWNDMNEPSVFDTPNLTMPLDNVHRIASDDFAPRNASHAEIHNVFGLENIRATYDGVRALRPDARAFVMTRAAYAGGQRYAATWTGDDSSTWDHLKLSVHQLINLGLSGFSYVGADVGGFTGGPSPELMTRWFEIAAFTPIFRDHSAKDTPRAEPWVDGPEHLAIRRRFVEERYRLMPYIYALADQNARSGDPLMRPVFYDYPQLLSAQCDQSMAFTLGSALLIAPPPKPESPESYDVCLPSGGWYDLWTGRPVVAAGGAAGTIDTVHEKPRLDYLPVYVRAGSILPSQPLVQSTAETPDGPLQLDIYPGADCHGALYLDDGTSMAFQKGFYLRQAVRCSMGPDGLRIAFARREGRYKPWWHQITIVVHGQGSVGKVSFGGAKIAARYDVAAKTVSFNVPDIADVAQIEIARE